MAFHSWSLALELAWNWGDSKRNKERRIMGTVLYPYPADRYTISPSRRYRSVVEYIPSCSGIWFVMIGCAVED